MRDYVYAAWFRQQIEDSVGRGMVAGMGVFTSLCRMPTCTTYLSSDGAFIYASLPLPF